MGQVMSGNSQLTNAKALFDRQDYQAARNVLNNIGTDDLNYQAARHFFARTYLSEKNLPVFLDACGRLVDEFPDHAQSFHLLGIALSYLHQLDGAEEAFRKALSLKPDDVPSAENLGIVLDLNGWKWESYTQLHQTLNKAGKLSRTGFLALIRNALLIGDKKTAFDATRFVLHQTPNDPDFVHMDARIAFAHHDIKGGKHLLETGLAQYPNSADLIADTGIYELSAGNETRAAILLRQTIKLEPHHSGAHYTLADMGGGAINEGRDDRDDRLAHMGDGIASSKTPYLKQVELGFAAGKVLDSQERYDDAFMCYDEANKKVWARMPTRAADVELPFEDIKKVFDTKLFSRIPASNPQAGSGMVYLVGMPRSGTTLLEQILSRLPSVMAGGETGELDSISAQLP